ncbi:hypothetical protein [Actinopolyspora halophila]|uniref:hypothetical protein n=1 Tax=Actinopolyspora halophila TaxID=1850 RepID=UPI0003A5D404|nr:hypothetical protein [Actinopolyspora halophila]
MTRFPDGRGHASATALVFRVALLLGMLIAFWLAAQWWNADRANAASAFLGTERTGPAAEVTGSVPPVEPIKVRSADAAGEGTAGEVADRITETSAEEASGTTAVDVDPVVEPLGSSLDSPDTAALVSERIEKAGEGTRPEDGDAPRELRPDERPAQEEAEATAPNASRRAARGAESTTPLERDDEPRAAAGSTAHHEIPQNSGVTFPTWETERADETDPDTTGSTEALAPEGKTEQAPEHPRRTPLPAPVKAPSTAQVVQPNTGSGPRDVHALHLEPLRLPTFTEVRSQQEHEGLSSGIKAAVPVTAPD